jgi:hypothetical protein
MTRLMLLATALAFGCSEPEMESTTQLFCRESTDSEVRLATDLLLRDGWRYAGPIHPNGINCYNVLFVREKRDR